MTEYHKIQTIYKRDMDSPRKTLLEGRWTLDAFEFLADNAWEWTEKVDGTNIRLEWHRSDACLMMRGRTDAAHLPPSITALMPELVEKFRAADLPPMVVYCEGYGPKIQSGGKYRADPGLVAFDVRVGDWWLRREDVEDVCVKIGLDVVPVLGHGTLREAVEYTRYGFGSRWGDFQAEGLVVRPLIELKTRAGERIIAKIKCRDFATELAARS